MTTEHRSDDRAEQAFQMVRDDSLPSFARAARRILQTEAEDLAAAWLSALKGKVDAPVHRIFPDKAILNHVPRLLACTAPRLEGVEIEEGDAAFVQEELERLGELRFAQGYGPDELSDEFETLARLILERLELECASEKNYAADEAILVSRRLIVALSEMSRITVQAVRRHLSDDRAERASLLDEFSRAVSHELRNRLNPAMLSLDLLAQQQTPLAEQKVWLERVRQSLRGIESVVSDVTTVAFAREAANPNGEPRRPLSEVVAAVGTALSELCEECGVRIVSDSIPHFSVDATRLELALVNIVGNAVKYCDERKQERWVRIAATPSDSERQWVLTVADNGIGMNNELATRVFEKSVRGNHSSVAGQGMGLFLAHRAIAQLGGSIRVDSIPGEGTTFFITLDEPAEEFR